MDKLTPKQQLFVQEYVADLNATQAAIRAGYSKKTAYSIGHENLSKPEIQEAIAEYTKSKCETVGINIEEVLREYRRIAFLDIRKAFDENGHLLPIHEMPEDVARAIAGVDVTSLNSEDNQLTITSKIKLIDKRGALQDLGKYLKMFADRVEHTGKNGEDLFPELDEFEFARRVAFILEEGLRTDEQCH